MSGVNGSLPLVFNITFSVDSVRCEWILTFSRVLIVLGVNVLIVLGVKYLTFSRVLIVLGVLNGPLLLVEC